MRYTVAWASNMSPGRRGLLKDDYPCRKTADEVVEGRNAAFPEEHAWVVPFEGKLHQSDAALRGDKRNIRGGKDLIDGLY